MSKRSVLISKVWGMYTELKSSTLARYTRPKAADDDIRLD
jgi:hypothetical protein